MCETKVKTKVHILMRGQCVKKLKIQVRTTTILYGGITFNSFFFTCYHYVIFYFGLIKNGFALLIIPNYLLFHTLQYFKDVQCHFFIPYVTLKSIYNNLCPCFQKYPIICSHVYCYSNISLTPRANTILCRCASMEQGLSGSRGNRQSYTSGGIRKGINIDIEWVVRQQVPCFVINT